MADPASAAPRWKSRAARFVIVFLALVAAACVVPHVLDPRLAPPSDEYANPEMVTIEGYSGSQEDPDISPDGQYLFFDTHDDAGNPSHLFFARRIDYKTFKFIGREPGINYQYEVEGMEDLQHNFYFVSPELVPQNGPMIFRGSFTGSSIESVAPVGGILPKRVFEFSLARFLALLFPSFQKLCQADAAQLLVPSSESGFLRRAVSISIAFLS
jgi:hypothetical protein